jgi:hypothetical protein
LVPKRPPPALAGRSNAECNERRNPTMEAMLTLAIECFSLGLTFGLALANR